MVPRQTIFAVRHIPLRLSFPDGAIPGIYAALGGGNPPKRFGGVCNGAIQTLRHPGLF